MRSWLTCPHASEAYVRIGRITVLMILILLYILSWLVLPKSGYRRDRVAHTLDGFVDDVDGLCSLVERSSSSSFDQEGLTFFLVDDHFPLLATLVISSFKSFNGCMLWFLRLCCLHTGSG